MNKTLLIGIILVVLAGILWWVIPANNNDTVACTADAMICPDGSSVGRVGPNCEFAPCPQVSGDTTWETTTQVGMTFRYPKDLGTTYIHTVDWPPAIQIINEELVCTNAGAPETRAGRTEERAVNGRGYCITELAEGAAGSTYTQYVYATVREGNTLIFTFTLRAPQCGNYNDPEKTACEAERTTFNLDGLVDEMMQSLQ